jgi:methionyl-tRNA formyltransferase
MAGMAEPIVFLGREDSGALAHLRAVEDTVTALGPSEPLTPEWLDEHRPRFVVSHGYRRILGRDALDRLPDRVVNLHISLLPYNRGADPNLWSVLEDTPSGVSIHYIDPGVDTGDVIAQRAVALADEDTFATSYARLQDAIVVLFREHWTAIAAGTCPRRPQPPGGTVHRVADQAAVAHLLPDGWDTPIGPLRGRCAASS